MSQCGERESVEEQQERPTRFLIVNACVFGGPSDSACKAWCVLVVSDSGCPYIKLSHSYSRDTPVSAPSSTFLSGQVDLCQLCSCDVKPPPKRCNISLSALT